MLIENSKHRGFTIVELLIVIVVIAILAAISVTAYNGIQQRANNVKIEQDITSYHKALTIYSAMHGGYAIPGSGDLGYCLGEVSAYPNGCSHATPNSTFADEIRKVISPLPAANDECLSYLSSCRRNYSLVRSTVSTLDGQPHLYYLIYYLHGDTTCSHSDSLEGSWGSFSTTKSKGYFERSNGNTMCVIRMNKPQ